jgi:multidrug efflux pump subunit AcrA (membrane-fusion protein)
LLVHVSIDRFLDMLEQVIRENICVPSVQFFEKVISHSFYFLWVVSPENTASQRPVVLGEQAGSNFVVEEGIKPGERIVVEGLQKVREGAPVNAMTAAQIAAAKSAPAAEEKPAKH